MHKEMNEENQREKERLNNLIEDFESTQKKRDTEAKEERAKLMR